MDALVEMFRFKTWATLRLIEYCEGLADEHLDATTPGTYGTIRETLRHMVDAEEGYFSILTRDRFPSNGAADRLEFKESLQHPPIRRRCIAVAETSGEGSVLGVRQGWRRPG